MIDLSLKFTPFGFAFDWSENKKVLLRERKRHTDRRVAVRWGCGQTDGWMDGWTDTCENITFPHPSNAVGNKLNFLLNIIDLSFFSMTKIK